MVTYTIPHIDIQNLHKQVMNSIYIEYNSYTKTEKLSFKIGRACSSFKNFISTPQASALTLLSFWAAFVVTYFLLTLAANTVLAYVVFGLVFLLYTKATFKAVDALIKEAILTFTI
jgi:hypothetical protein